MGGDSSVPRTEKGPLKELVVFDPGIEPSVMETKASSRVAITEASLHVTEADTIEAARRAEQSATCASQKAAMLALLGTLTERA